ncbi:endonuclease/exonuclease/phosphatase family protein [Terriglobus roseus]|uniref:Endonuclease/Exonuclease/phosphatase family protein n=1 Tax=Terriglobus roseus TaxID=392734 RepID=A0A1G7H2H5_9BACT|nr:endonuclease/exonuclease/phosphatase family protein [Terriglobus roseus]SDE94555.1 Endonuclease/Exonuclease/phosphatase family protein [Terriglobus roseus]
MRIMTWNCCWRLADKIQAIFAEKPDIAVIQECSKQDLELVSNDYKSLWLGGDLKHGLGMIYHNDYSVQSVKNSDLLSFAAVELLGPRAFTLIAAWNCKEGGSSYPEHLHLFLDQHAEWFNARPVVFAGDLNSQAGASFDKGRRRHIDFVERMSQLGLTDCPEKNQSATFEQTYRHQWSSSSVFHLDYIFIPEDWAPKVSSVTVGASTHWSRLSDHSPIILTIAE